ncbi:hypothetical protein GQ457_07G003470 [Hibiscus cannabinus]
MKKKVYTGLIKIRVLVRFVKAPQLSEVALTNPRFDSNSVAPLSGLALGRLPDASVLLHVSISLERVDHPENEEDEQVTKKSRGEGDVVMDVGGVGFKGFTQGITVTTGYDAMACTRDELGGGGSMTSKPSFRDMLTGRLGEGLVKPQISDLDVDMEAGDVQITSMDGTPRVCFSERVHNMVDDKLAKSVIVRLLGRSIGYTVMLNRIRAMWNLSGEIAMVDLDNGYYLICFALENDMSKVFTGGPWLIYGHYLTVQPWSRSFSTAKDYPDQIVVWVRLPGLSYRYYTKSMFRCIAGVIGKIVKIDYNTTEGKRGKFARLAVVVDLKKPLISSIIIDNFHQKIEYEGLPIIFYGCGCYGHTEDVCKLNASDSTTEERGGTDELSKSDTLEKFGPWMQVMSKRARKGASVRLEQNSELQHRVVALKTQDSVVDDTGMGVDSKALPVSNEGVEANMFQSFNVGDCVSGARSGSSHVELVNGFGSTSKSLHANENVVVERLDVASSKRIAQRVPNRGKQSVIWSQLEALRPSGNVAWLLGGDFNAIVSSSKRMGGSSRRDGISVEFGDFLQRSGLNDLWFHGARFKWKRGTLHQRLDRCLVSDEWWWMWPHSHVEFQLMFTRVWNSDDQIVRNISNFQAAASVWSRDSFGHIGRRKRTLMARIRGIEWVNEASSVYHLQELENKLKRELNEVLKQEEILWFQRAHTEWINDGDRNTNY